MPDDDVIVSTMNDLPGDVVEEVFSEVVGGTGTEIRVDGTAVRVRRRPL